tara:strand:- start:13 stop:519 length:507 start_codon:yes stop_codon:yes gene_type:complete
MSESEFCPVPIEQQPTEEFKKLCQSWFFSIPYKKEASLVKTLITSWLIILPVNIFIGCGSWILRNDIPKLFLICSFTSLALPLLLLLRQWLGWKYIFKRLVSEIIEYEESGWYDGQTWEKPTEWREKDMLIAQHEVKPLIEDLIKSLKIAAILIVLGLVIYITNTNIM